jgi:hypothetical protein
VVEIDSLQMGSFHRKVVRHRCIRGAAPNTFGNESRTDPRVDAPGLVNIDLLLAKQFRFTEKLRLNVRGELFNSLNHFNPGQPNSTVGNPAIGRITSAQNGPRVAQISLRLMF